MQVLKGNQRGVGLVVADGGFLAARDRHDQERVVFRLMAAEALAMCMVLRPGGLFVCKLFDTVCPCTASLVFILSQMFEAIALVQTVCEVAPAGACSYLCG